MKTLAIAANLLLAVAAIGFGNLFRSLIPKAFSQLDRIVLTLLGGVGLLGTVLFCVGQVWFSRSAIILVLLLGVLLSLCSLAVAIRKGRRTLASVLVPVYPFDDQ